MTKARSKEKELPPDPIKTDQELRQIALDLADGKIFSDRHVPKSESKTLLSIFMALSLWDHAQEWVKDAGMIFEYHSKAGPRSINGYPMFISCQKLNKEDTKTVFTYYNELLEQRKQFLSKGN